ncbi:MAG: hypothetical protein ABI175_22870, partial [Polyangiales bacterium]
MSCHVAFASLLLAACLSTSLSACLDSGGASSGPADPDLQLAAEDEPDSSGGAWDVAPTLHVGERATGRASAHGRRVYPVWIAGTETAPVPLDVIATAIDGDDVRVAVLGPIEGDDRPVLAAGGYAQPRGNVEMTVEITTTGQHLIVVGAFDLARETTFDVHAHCETCAAGQTDLLASPKDGALVATGDRIVHVTLGDVLADRDHDVEVELWASPPASPSAAQLVATSVASGNQVNAIVPASVVAGDDLRLIVRDPASGAVLEAGLTTRFAPELAALVRTDALRYGADDTVGASGILGFYEGYADLSLRDETTQAVINDATVTASRPGQVGNGWNAFDAVFSVAEPHTGALYSIGSIDGNGGYRRLACFAYGNGTR